MIPHSLPTIKSRSEWREWLEQNHRKQTECWIAVKRGRPIDDNTFWYLDAVEEALCFGWIDSTTKKMPDGTTLQRFCPRRPRSKWSELNKERCRRMERLGRMTEDGRAALPDMSDKGFSIDPDLLQELQSDPVVWEHFCHLPELYKRVRIDTIQIKKHQPKLYRSRLENLWKTPGEVSSMAAGTTTDDYKPKLRSTFYFSTHTTFQQTPIPLFPGEAGNAHRFPFRESQNKRKPLAVFN